LERAVRSNPLDAHNYALLSDLHLNRWVAGPPTAARDVSDLSQAVIYARKAAAVDPARAEYYMRIGRLHELRWSRTGQTQDYRDAVSAYIRAEELFPSQPEAALNLARIYDLGGRQDLALGKYRRARQLDQEQYHIPRQFTPAERAELDDRIEALSSSYTSHTEAPPPAFKQPTLLGWPRRMLTAEPDSRNRR
jgi:tetratricopeptide (TPR) repeat protein